MNISSLRLFISLFTLFCALGFAQEPQPVVPKIITLRGYLGSDELSTAKKLLDEKPLKLVITVNSNGGDLPQVLEFAKKIYNLKREQNTHVTVYINDYALGPAAILPLLADEIDISVVTSWGAIPLGTEDAVSTNVLSNQVISLIDASRPHAELLKLMAMAMSDPAFGLVIENGVLKPASDGKGVSVKGETLVLNQNQLIELGIVKAVIKPEEFYKQYSFSEQQVEAVQQTSAISRVANRKQALVDSLKEHIKFDPNRPNFIGYIVIDDRTSGINQSTWLYVKKALDYYKENKPRFIILELNTPGGEVYAAQKISDALKEMDTQFNIPVVAFINNWAISAGAMLAYSCRYIAVVKDASMGAAEPIIAGQSGETKEASEKVNSAIRTDFANRAQFFDRNPYIAEAMVDKDLILVMRHGKIIKLDSESQIRYKGPDSDEIISPKGKLLTLNAEQLMRYGVADILLQPAKLDPITEKEKEAGKWPASKNLLFHSPYFEEIPTAVIDEYKVDWKTRFFMFLSHPVVSSILFMGMLLGFYMEMNNPGMSLPGTIGLTCLFLIILSSFALEIGSMLELILLVAGMLIILVEVFVLPTFGLLGFIGIIFFLAGLFGLMLPGLGSVSYEFDTQTFNAAGEVFFQKLAWLSVSLVISLIIMGLLGKYVMPKFGLFNRFVLKGNEQEGYLAVDTQKDLPKIGTKGEVISTLRPAGKVMINDTVYDAISPGNFIEKGTKIHVVGADSGSLIVNEDLSGE